MILICLLDEVTLVSPTGKKLITPETEVQLQKDGAMTFSITTLSLMRRSIIKQVSWFKSSLLLRIQSDYITDINS